MGSPQGLLPKKPPRGPPRAKGHRPRDVAGRGWAGILWVPLVLGQPWLRASSPGMRDQGGVWGQVPPVPMPGRARFILGCDPWTFSLSRPPPRQPGQGPGRGRGRSRGAFLDFPRVPLQRPTRSSTQQLRGLIQPRSQNPRIPEAGRALPDRRVQPVTDPHLSTSSPSSDTSGGGDSKPPWAVPG